MALDSSGNVAATGQFNNTVNSVRHGGTGDEVGLGVAVTNDGRFYATGRFAGFAEFGGNAYSAVGAYDGFIVGMEAF